MNWADYTGSLLKHLRTQPVDHRIMVQTLCKEKVTYLETTEKIERVGCLRCLAEARRRGILLPSETPQERRGAVETATTA